MQQSPWKHTLVPRLLAAGADLTRVGRFEVVNYADDELMLSLPHDNVLLECAVTEHQAALVTIDPLLSVIGEKINTHASREVRSALDPLARMADRTSSVLLGIAHFNKGAGTDASSLITGSGAFKDVPRSVFGFARDEADDSGGRVMTQTKNSLGPEGPSLAYVLEEAVVDTKLGAAVTSRFTFTGESDRSVSDVLRENRGGDREEADESDAVDRWLQEFLAEERQTASDVYRAADSAGYSKDQAKRAKKRLQVIAEHPDLKGPWYWALPPREHPREQGSRETKPRSLCSLDAPLVEDEDDSGGRRRHEDAEDARTQTVAPSAPSVAPSGELPLFGEDDEANAADNQDPLADDPTDDLDSGQTAGRDVADNADDLERYSSECRTCRQLLLLSLPGRDQCERCRLDQQEETG